MRKGKREEMKAEEWMDFSGKRGIRIFMKGRKEKGRRHRKGEMRKGNDGKERRREKKKMEGEKKEEEGIMGDKRKMR